MLDRKHDAIADYLVKIGADVTVANRAGQTAGHRAATYGHVQILRLLMLRGADFNAMVTMHVTFNIRSYTQSCRTFLFSL